jgi:hypothetical protein
VRWEQLFAELEARFDELADAQMMAELADRQRLAAGSVGMVQRFAGAVGATLRIRTQDGPVVGGQLREVGPDWLLLGQQGPGELLVALRAVTGVEGLAATTGPPLSALAMRMDLRLALRGLARDRSPVLVTVAGAGGSPEGRSSDLSGTIDRVGADFVELAQHAVWEPRRAMSVRSVALVPLAAIITVRSMPAG